VVGGFHEIADKRTQKIPHNQKSRLKNSHQKTKPAGITKNDSVTYNSERKGNSKSVERQTKGNGYNGNEIHDIALKASKIINVYIYPHKKYKACEA